MKISFSLSYEWLSCYNGSGFLFYAILLGWFSLIGSLTKMAFLILCNHGSTLHLCLFSLSLSDASSFLFSFLRNGELMSESFLYTARTKKEQHTSLDLVSLTLTTSRLSLLRFYCYRHMSYFILLLLNLLLDHAIVLVRITKTFVKWHSLVRTVKDYFDASHHRFSHHRGVID